MFVSSKFSNIAIITEFCENSYYSKSLFQSKKEKTNQTIRSSLNLEIAFQKGLSNLLQIKYCIVIHQDLTILLQD